MDSSLSNRIAIFRNEHSRVDQQLNYEQQTITRLHARIDKIKDESAELLKAVGLLDRCIEVISANGIGKIESIVTAGMRTIFKDDTLGLIVEKKDTARGHSFRLLIQHGDTIGNPMESFGGGVQNVTAFLLRVILIKRFKLAKFLAVDESFNNVSVDYINYVSAVSAMLKTLTEDHGFTILAITQVAALTESAKYVYELKPGKTPTLVLKDMDDEADKT